MHNFHPSESVGMTLEDEFSGSDEPYEGDERDENDFHHPQQQQSTFDYTHHMLYSNYDALSTRPYSRPKTRRRRWTQRDMTNAYNAVKYQGLSLRGAATAFNVPESTLRDRVHGRVSLQCSRPGPPTFFTFEEEKKMVDHILFMSKIGYPYTRNQVVELAGDMTKAVGRIAPFKYVNPSQAWFYAFLNRWPDLKNFLFGPRSNRKSKGVSGDSIQSYFEQLEKVLLKYGIKDKRDHFWVVDEVSISCDNQPPRILPISIQRAQSTSFWNPTVAMLGAANGAGEKIPPFLIYRGDCITHTIMQGAVRGTKFSYSSSGWVNSDAFIQWFLKHFRTLITLRPLILFYDGHLQFVSVRVLERAREDNVFLFPLPPHPAYNHCVENTCFWTFQSYFNKRLDRFFEQHPNQPLLRNNAAPVLTHAYEKALQPSNITQLFERLGICPFNNLSSSIDAYTNIHEDFDNPNYSGENVDPQTATFDTYGPPDPWSIPVPSYATAPNCINGDWKDYVLNNGTPNTLHPTSLPLLGEPNANLPTVRLGALNPSESRAIHTSISPSGRPVTIMLQGPAAKALQPLGRASSLPVTSATGPSHTENVLRHSADTEEIAHSNVEIAHEEEVGYDGPPGHHTQYGVNSMMESGAMDATELINQMEDGEAPDFCVVCGQVEPPESACQPSDLEGNDDLQVVDWIHCDYCNRWSHLNGSCSEDGVFGKNSFMCTVCKHDGIIGEKTTTLPTTTTTSGADLRQQPPMATNMA